MAVKTEVKPKTRQVEVPIVVCDYCGYEGIQLNQVVGQSGEKRHICGDCFISVFDEVLEKTEPKEQAPVIPEEPETAPPTTN